MVEYAYDTRGMVLNVTGSMAGTWQDSAFPRRNVYEEETELYYLMTRYFNSKSIRFINSDNYVSSSQDLVDQCSFLYCGNNPICREDRTGEFFNTLFGAIIGAAWAVITKDEKETVGQAILRGAATGALAGAGLDVCIATAGAGGIAIAAVAGAAGGALDTAWEASNNGRDASAGEIIIGGVVGGSMNMLFGASGREVGRAVGTKAKQVILAMKKNTMRSISGKSGRIIGKKVATEVFKNVLSSGSQAVFGKVYSMIGSSMLAEFTQ